MDRDAWFQAYESAPSGVRFYLMDRKAKNNEYQAQSSLAYDHDAWDRVMDVVWDTVFAGLSQADFKERLRRLAGDRKPEDVERVVLFNVVLPLGDLVSWDVEARLQELGVPIGEIHAQDRVSLRPVSYGAAARRIAAQAKVSLLSEELVRRLREIIMSFMKGVRTIEQVKEILRRSQSEGGLGFDQPQADAYTDAMQEFLQETQVLSEQEYAEWLSKGQGTRLRQDFGGQARDKGQVGADLGVRPAADASSGDDDEVARMASTTPKTPARIETALGQAVETAFAAIALPDLDEYMAKRLRGLISTRVREVRNAEQARAILERDQKLGGMGLPPPEADRVARAIEKAFEDNRQSIAGEEKQRIQTIMVEQQQKVEDRKKRESEEHAKWFEEKVKAGRAEDALRAVMQGAGDLPAGKAGKGPASVPLRGTMAGRQETRDKNRPYAVDPVTPPSVRLSGLSEELGSMDVASFRRLAKSPQEAAEKIRQKIETLKQESFESWTDGVEAWRSSPLQQQYLKLVAESFGKGMPVAEVALQKRAADPSFLSPEEVSAIVSLNGKIQF